MRGSHRCPRAHGRIAVGALLFAGVSMSPVDSHAAFQAIHGAECFPWSGDNDFGMIIPDEPSIKRFSSTTRAVKLLCPIVSTPTFNPKNVLLYYIHQRGSVVSRLCFKKRHGPGNLVCGSPVGVDSANWTVLTGWAPSPVPSFIEADGSDLMFLYVTLWKSAHSGPAFSEVSSIVVHN